ncbi:MAG TPA: methyltransferase domain-containing protein [Candidatus Dependentiae bacterium]|nr:methyltransferase domain-containing protein [Candidatus Dependentiae bacterium]HRQ62589.1 methyltransferase domain-containing protein [Candidatus Dependentiae bacterium]
MKPIFHTSALPEHYDPAAETYDAFNEQLSATINQTITNILKEHKVRSVLDMTCGTGSQVFWLTQEGFKVVGSDINKKMLDIARQKAKANNLDIQFIEGDMRTTQIDTFDAVITIFNAVGHLTKSDFEQAIRNIYSNLNPGGLYIFDIFNLDYLLHGNNITTLTIDWQKIVDNIAVRDIQYSTIDQAGILSSYTTHYVKKDNEEPTITESAQTLQVYTAQQLQDMLQRNGFKVLNQCAIDGSSFAPYETERILIVAQKV